MKKRNKIILLIFLLVIFISPNITLAAPEPWGIAINPETNECSDYWGGDEFVYNHLPDGWEDFYFYEGIDNSRFYEIVGKNEKVNSAINNFIRYGAEILCEDIGFNYEIGDITYSEIDHEMIDRHRHEPKTFNFNSIVFVVGIIIFILLILILIFFRKNKKIIFISLLLLLIYLLVLIIFNFSQKNNSNDVNLNNDNYNNDDCEDETQIEYYFEKDVWLSPRPLLSEIDMLENDSVAKKINNCGYYQFLIKKDNKWEKVIARRGFSGVELDNFNQAYKDFFQYLDEYDKVCDGCLFKQSLGLRIDDGNVRRYGDRMRVCGTGEIYKEEDEYWRGDIDSQECLNFEDLYAESYFAENENRFLDPKKQIAVNFLDDYKIYNDRQIGFGPLSRNLGPNPQDESLVHHFDLEIEDYLEAKYVISNLKSYNKNLTIEPVILKVGDFEVVKYAEGGMCEKRAMKVIGKRFNYDFSSNGCVNDGETDFDYLTKTIEQMEIIETEDFSLSTNSVYEDENLHLRIKYYSSPENKILTKRVGNRVYFYPSGYDYESGQYIEKFDKEKDLSLAEAIENDLLGAGTADYCFVETKSDSIDSQKAIISFPSDVACENNEPSWVCANCSSYRAQNGVATFIYYKSQPDVYFYISIGQASLMTHINGLSGEEIGKLEWFNNIEAIGSGATR